MTLRAQYATGNDLPEATRRDMCALLNTRLAQAIDLASQAKQAHWNVKGPRFYALHELFDEVAEGVVEHVDTLAERIVQLGGVAEGTVVAVSRATTLPAYPLDIVEGTQHLEALRAGLIAFATAARTGVDQAAKAGDADTADILTEVSRDADKYLWLVEAHLQATR